MRKVDVQVVSQQEIAKNIFEIRLSGDVVREMTTPGQFVHLRAPGSLETLLRRPISIADVDLQKSEFRLIYRVEGAGTQNLSEKQRGDRIDCLGPLGNGFPVERAQRGQTAIFVGGGVGVPPLYYLGRQLVQKGLVVKSVLGFSSAAEVFYENEFAALGETRVTTVDGSYGQQGFVTDAMHDLDFDVLYACGPTPMLKALEECYAHHEAYFSLEERMGCALGVCMACVCPLAGDESGVAYRKVCKDGPVFPLGEVVL